MEKARLHHYVFAHRLLPGLFLSTPGEMLNGLRSRGTPLVVEFWDRLGASLEHEPALPARGLSLAFHDLPSGAQAAVVTLPAPEAVPEAHFAALVLPAGEETRARYFTLECSLDFASGLSMTMLCEWTVDGAHLNHGPGPGAEAGGFLASVTALLEDA